jgi:hypothetical protein
VFALGYPESDSDLCQSEALAHRIVGEGDLKSIGPISGS